MMARILAFPLAVLLIGACVDDPRAELPGARVAVEIAPLSLPGISDATYTLALTNLGGQAVWTRTITSGAYGDGAGSASLVAPCDADASPNTLTLTLDALEVDGVALTEGLDYLSPSRDAALSRPVMCLEGVDAAVSFDLTVARPARQGFFDIAVAFDDLFCSAKLDCLDDGAELQLLHDPETGARALTAVLAFSCTAGPGGGPTHLYMDDLQIACSAPAPHTLVVPVGGPAGNQNPPFPPGPGGAPNDTDLLYQVAIYRGEQGLSGVTAGYWQIALGLNADAFPNVGTCTLTTSATASGEPLTNGFTPPGGTWPYVAWEVELVSGGARACANHPLDASAGDVETRYLSDSEQFGVTYAPASGTLTVNAPCDCDDDNPCTEDTCVLGVCEHAPANEGYTEPCYDGPPGTAGVAACHSGTRTCAAGVFGACAGQVLPQPEVCGGGDEDCDGTSDDTALPYVRSDCTDVAAGGTASASSSYPGSPPSAALDHCSGNSWNSGGYAGWWQVSLPSPTVIDGLSVLPAVVPPGNVYDTVYVRPSPSAPFVSVYVHSGYLGSQLYQWQFATPVLASDIRITTTSSPSWVAWTEISAFSCPD